MNVRNVLWPATFAIALLAFSSFAGTQSPAKAGLQVLSGVSSVEGETVFREKGCFNCHSYDNAGGSTGPDLGIGRMRGTSPSALAAAMWNHAPAMWRSIGNTPTLSLREAAALYSFLYFRLYSEQSYPNVQHGQRYFQTHCGSCHDLMPNAESSRVGPPAGSWGKVTDPMALSALMWNHSTKMLDQINRDSKSWPRMTGEDVTDLLAYLWRMPQLLPEHWRSRFGNDQAGENLFTSRCAECHTIRRVTDGRIDLTGTLQHSTLPEIAASMWNHAPAMKRSNAAVNTQSFSEEQMRDLLTFLVVRTLFDEPGDAVKGLRVFQAKKCEACHGQNRLNPGAPPLTSFNGPFDGVRMTAVLWSHGPRMLSEMKSAGIPWPRINKSEMEDLLAFLNRKTSQ